MAEARTPGLPRYQTFRSQPGRAAPPEPPAEFLALGMGPESARLPRAVATATAFPMQLRALLLCEALAFFLALVFLLRLCEPTWISLVSRFCWHFPSRGISSSPISVWVWARDAVLISVKRSARASRAASDLVFPPRHLLILLLGKRWPLFLASQTVDAYSLIYLLLFLRLGSEIFLASEKTRRVSRLGRIDRGGFLVLH